MDNPAKKILYLKIILTVIFSTLLPALLGFFIPLTPIFYILIGMGCSILSVLFLFWILAPFIDNNLNPQADIRSNDELEKLQNDSALAISEKNKLHEIIYSLIDGIVVLDFNKNILLFNKAASELTGFTETEVIGKPIDQLIHFFAMQDEILPKTFCQGDFNQSAKIIGKDGKQTKINLITTQVDGTVKSNINCILIMHDLSKEEELEQMKLDFVSMASHELKTPLTSIVGYLSVFLDENRNKVSKENLELLDKAFTATQQLQTLIQNLLNVNKIEKEKFSVAAEPIDYFPILSKSIEDLKALATQKNILLTLQPSENIPKVMADPMRLSEVITNLVANAINYTNPGGKVEVLLNLSPTEITTTISDTGIGIPKEAMPHLFNKFFRVSNLEQKANKGTGLGLYISKSIIEKLHGKIWAESEEGRGSRFSFTLPIVSSNAGIIDSNKFTSSAIQSGTLNY